MDKNALGAIELRIRERLKEVAKQHPGPRMTWLQPEGYPGNLWILGRECTVWLQPRPSYCDRGRYLALLDPWGELARNIDEADGWPRYYFDLDRAKAEVEAWLVARKQHV